MNTIPTSSEPNDAHVELELERVIHAVGGTVLTGGPVWEADVIGSEAVPGARHSGILDLAFDLYPWPPTPAQDAALGALGYGRGDPHEGVVTYDRPDRRVRLHFFDPEGDRWFARVITRDHVLADPGGRAAYEAALTSPHRKVLFDELDVRAHDWYVRKVGWTPVTDLARDLADLPAPWVVTSGWAVDLHAGEVQRAHRDLDVSVSRADQSALLGHLHGRGWRLDVVDEGRYRPWTPGETLEAPIMQVHARQGRRFVDVLLGEGALGGVPGEPWRFRRDPTVTRDAALARRVGPLGVPYLAPELVLLFKSSFHGAAPRGKDAQDFERTLPLLDDEARAWLAQVLARRHPGHPWITRLQEDT
ncbi:nucleotidyltransferase domain-containing protein [Deinococcus pimensis]|uniref:nucleotidyltransferase domain-containing protein n=1 Tax=Deinococcus pimensis TaxID=309888 RepID=UPI0004BAB729|nr:GrpB family protein [Deinococcus pimensis]